jgi:hypothetical protein
VNPAEEDVARAVKAQWDASPVAAAVPGGLSQDVPPSPLAGTPYAVFEVEQGPGEDEYTCPAVPGSTVVHHHRVMIHVHGARDDVKAALTLVEQAFQNRTFNVPNSACIGCLPVTDHRFRREPRKKAGVDVWEGRRDYELIHERVIQ